MSSPSLKSSAEVDHDFEHESTITKINDPDPKLSILNAMTLMQWLLARRKTILSEVLLLLVHDDRYYAFYSNEFSLSKLPSKLSSPCVPCSAPDIFCFSSSSRDLLVLQAWTGQLLLYLS